MLCPTSESPTSDGRVICSHGELLKQKILTQTRGENLIHAVPPDLLLRWSSKANAFLACIETTFGVSLKPLTEPLVLLTR